MTAVSCSISLWLVLMFAPAARAQSGAVGFRVSPNEFRAGQSVSALLSITSTSISLLTISAGDTFTFVFDSSVGTVSSILGPVSVNSASLAAGDFSASFGATQVVVTYNGQPKPFSFGSTLGVEVSFTASGQVGTGKISFSSRFTGSVNGNLPYTPVSIVDFANSGVTSVVHDGTLTGNGTSGAPLGVVPGSVPVSTDGTTLTGNGTTAMPLGVKVGSVPIAHGFTLSGDGTAGNPLNVVNGTVAVTHDPTLTGDGTGGTPLAIAVPLTLSGSSTGSILHVQNAVNGTSLDVAQGHINGGLTATGGTAGGDGIAAFGGDVSGAGLQAGDGVFAKGGTGSNGAANGFAGDFSGDVRVLGTLSKSGGSLKIDHPLDPANKYLSHSFVESPEMMNIYNGNAKLDSNGEAVIELPAWFGALNKDFRYLLTPIGGPGPGLYIAEEIADNRFKIAGGASGLRVSWQVTGIRQDAWANAHRIPVEEAKSDKERGHYIHPELFDQPEEKSIQWARHPELMKRVKERREQQMKQAGARDGAVVAGAQGIAGARPAGGQLGNSQASAKAAGR